MVIENGKIKRASWDRLWREREFEKLWRQSQPRVWRLTARLSGSVDHADDLCQEVAVAACQAYSAFRGRSSASTWLYRIAVNIVLRSNERKRHPTVTLDSPGELAAEAPQSGPEARALSSDRNDRVWRAVQGLPEEMRVTLILQIYEELKYREIAEVLKIPIGTVKSRLNAAISRLREELDDHDL